MLLRVCLILAILAGLGVIGLTQFVIRPQMQETIATRDENFRQWKDFENKFTDASRKLDATQKELTETSEKLEQTQADLTLARNRADEQERRANGLKTSLDQTKAELNEAQQELAKWEALGIPVEGVKALIASVNGLREQVAALQTEREVLVRVNERLQDKIDRLLGPDRIPELPSDLVGQVVAVDPKWDFVVLNVGENKSVKFNAQMIVVRDGEFIGKVSVTDVRTNSCIANIMPGWKVGEVMEGDTVIPPNLQ